MSRDKESPPADAEWFAQASVYPGGGPPAKQSIHLRVAPDVLSYFKSLGPGYQTRMHHVLETYVRAATKRTR